MHFDFICRAREYGRTATGTEVPSSVVPCFAFYGHRILRKHRSGEEEGAVVLPTVQAMAKPNPIRAPRRHDLHVTAQATASKTIQLHLREFKSGSATSRMTSCP